jgi:hypothetical protein
MCRGTQDPPLPRSRSIFGPSPPCGTVHDILARVFDITGFAVHAVLEIDLELRARARADESVHTCGTISRWARVFQRKVHADWYIWIGQVQVRRLALLPWL